MNADAGQPNDAGRAEGEQAPRRVEIVEVSPRDGLQNEKKLLPTATKVELIQRSVRAGLRRIEVTAFARPDRVPQMADAEDVLAAVAEIEGLSKIGLVLNRKGVERAIAAGCDEITAVVVASDGLALKNQGRDTAAQVAAWLEIAEDARSAGLRTSVILAASFGCPFDGVVAPAHVIEVAKACLAGAPDELAIADTIGVGVPSQVRTIVAGLRALPDLSEEIALRAHFHNTRNTGYANALAAIEAGVSVLDASTGGIGGCPFAPGATGNIGTEDLLYMLDRTDGVELSHRADAGAIAETGIWIADQLGLHQAPAQLGRAGWFPPSA